MSFAGYATILTSVQSWTVPGRKTRVIVGDHWIDYDTGREVEVVDIYVAGEVASIRIRTVRGGKSSNTCINGRNLIKRFSLVRRAGVTEPSR